MNKAKTANPDPNPLSGRTPREYAGARYLLLETKLGDVFVLAHSEDSVFVSSPYLGNIERDLASPSSYRADENEAGAVRRSGRAYRPLTYRGAVVGNFGTGYSRGPDGNWRHGSAHEWAEVEANWNGPEKDYKPEYRSRVRPYVSSVGNSLTPKGTAVVLAAILAALPDWAARHAGDLADGRLRSASEEVRRAEEAAQKALDAWNEAKLALDLADAELRKAEARVAEFGPAKGLPAGTADEECPSCGGSVAVRLCPQDGSLGVCGDDFHRAGLAGGN